MERVKREKRKQTKYVVDLKDHQKEQVRVEQLLKKANEKEFGVRINFRDLFLYSLSKLRAKDIARLQIKSMSLKEKLWHDYRNNFFANDVKMDFWDFVCSQHKPVIVRSKDEK